MNSFTFLLRYEGTIYLLSAASTLLFAIVIFSLIHSAQILQEKRWAIPFAQTFLVLALLYVLKLIDHGLTQTALPTPANLASYMTHHAIGIVVLFCSGLTNYLFILTAFRLSQPALDGPSPGGLIRWLIGSDYFLSPLFWLLSIGSLVGFPDGWYTVPDIAFSTVALVVPGLVLYQNISVRRDKVMAWLALLSALGYAVLYVVSGAYFIANLDSPNPADSKLVGLITIAISWPLKFGLFLSGYSLMLLISGPLQGIEHLLENVTRKRKEYFESDGLMKSIREELQVNKVALYIKLPGLEGELLALYDYPSSGSVDKQGPKEIVYDRTNLYHEVMTSGRPKRDDPENMLHPLIPHASTIGVPVFFHNSVIACLQAEIGRKKFTKSDQINFERIATLISPAVQTFREMAGLNKISQDAGQHQLQLDTYEMERDIPAITRIIHKVLAPLATGISIEIGFVEYSCIYPVGDVLEGLIKKRLADEGNTVSDSSDIYRWYKTELKIAMSSSGRKFGQHVFGKFIFATDNDETRRDPATLGTNTSSLRAISNLVRETTLRFIRGFLNQTTDLLSVRLGGLKRTTVEAWWEVVENVIQDAGVLWVVTTNLDEDDRLIGFAAHTDLVNSIESLGPTVWERKGKKSDDLWLYRLEQADHGTHSIIKKRLKNSKLVVWLGVARKGFGRELDYESPWKYFLDHFWEIAESALIRIVMNEKQKRRMGEVQSIIASTLTIGPITHNLINLTGLLVERAARLVDADNNQDRLAIVSELRERHAQIEKLLPQLTDVYKRDLRQPCSLDEAVTSALERVQDLSAHRIKIVRRTLPDLLLEIPFDAAANAFAIVIDNAKDAILDKRDRKRAGNASEVDAEEDWIRISARKIEGKDRIVCEISDSGLGVPHNVRETLLKKVSKSRKKNSHGVGLLFSVDLLRLYNGDIVLAEHGPNPNTTFRIYFQEGKNFTDDVLDDCGIARQDTVSLTS